MSPVDIAVIAGAALLVLFIVWSAVPRRARRARIVKEPAPSWWRARLDDMLPYFRRLTEDGKAAFIDEVAVFLHDQRFEPVSAEPDEVDYLFVAGTAVMMAAGLEGFRYPNHRAILIYPEAFDDDYGYREDGERLGELLGGGPMILTLPSLRESQSFDDAINVAVHELAHVLDSMVGDSEHYGSELDERIDDFFADDVLMEAIETERSPLDPYALENEAEFFAVCSELFFHDPPSLEAAHPQVYAWLVDVYRQDPQRPPNGSASAG